MQLSQKKYQRGFTLIEVSIVMMIIALLTGAILMAQSVIRQAEIKSLTSEYDVTKKAIIEFRNKYMGLPGDLSNAETIWGSDRDCPATSSNIEPKIPTCNGDGNGSIGSSTNTGELSSTHEWFRAWQQLSNAGLIQGSYTGTSGPRGPREAVIGVNVPLSQVSGAGWTLNYMLLNASGPMWGDQYGHLLHLGSYREGDYTRGPVLSPAEALALDTKMDDGSPGRGIIRSWRTSLMPDCTINDTNQDTAAYNATLQEHVCSLVFLLGF